MVGSPLSPCDSESGRELEQSEMYSRSPMGRPATEAGAWVVGGIGSGKVVAMTPVEVRASMRRAIRAEVNQDGRRVETSGREASSWCPRVACWCGLLCGMAEAEERVLRARSPVRMDRKTILEACELVDGRLSRQSR